jgi:hypothetical protein
MPYLLALLTGLLIGFFIKDLYYKSKVIQVNRDVTNTLRYLSKFVVALTPLTPDEFLPLDSTGVAFVDNQMFLVKAKDGQLVTFTDYPMKFLLGNRFADLRITAYIPTESLVKDALSRIARIIG